MAISDAELVHGFLQEISRILRLEFARRLKAQRRRFPRMMLPCESCAFRASTESWPGFEKTTVNFVAAMAAGEVFWCHQGFEIGVDGEYHPPRRRVDGHLVLDRDKLRPCDGWLVFTSTPPLRIRKLLPPSFVELCLSIAGRKARAL